MNTPVPVHCEHDADIPCSSVGCTAREGSFMRPGELAHEAVKALEGRSS